MTRADRKSAPRERQVLVVDDEPDIRELLELTLAAWGWAWWRWAPSPRRANN